MDIALIITRLDTQSLQTFCDTCEQPLVVTGEFALKIVKDNGRKYLIGKEIPCNHCNRKRPIPRTFEDSQIAASEFIRIAQEIYNQNSLGKIIIIPLIETMDLEEIYS